MQKAANRGVFVASMEKKSRHVSPATMILAEGTNEALYKKDDITNGEIKFINRVVCPINLDAAEDE
jgi:hypothetical protein